MVAEVQFCTINENPVKSPSFTIESSKVKKIQVIIFNLSFESWKLKAIFDILNTFCFEIMHSNIINLGSTIKSMGRDLCCWGLVFEWSAHNSVRRWKRGPSQHKC